MQSNNLNDCAKSNKLHESGRFLRARMFWHQFWELWRVACNRSHHPDKFHAVAQSNCINTRQSWLLCIKLKQLIPWSQNALAAVLRNLTRSLRWVPSSRQVLGRCTSRKIPFYHQMTISPCTTTKIWIIRFLRRILLLWPYHHTSIAILMHRTTVASFRVLRKREHFHL